jgi:DNA-directed RNA polymerase omega subunit
MHRIPDNVDSKFRFITIVAMRARQLQRGARARVESEATKPVAVARQEVEGKLIDFQTGEEAMTPLEENEVNPLLEG